MKKVILLLVAGAISSAVDAAPTQALGKVDYVTVIADGRIQITLDTNRDIGGMCADYQGWYIKDENSAAGMAQLSVALSAKQSGR
jgi:hypothetical protein